MSTVSLFEQLCKQILDYYFSGFTTQDNIRPAWSEFFEIDRFYPQLGVAIEFQGPQHYRQVASMQTGEKFKIQLEADSKKRIFINRNGFNYVDLAINDFMESSYINTVTRIKNLGAEYALKKGDAKTYQALTRKVIGHYPDRMIFRRLEGIKRARTFSPRYQPQQKPKKLFGVF